MNLINNFTLDNTGTDNITEETQDNQSENYHKISHDIDIKDVISRINRLNIKEKNHILNILRMTKIDYTKNANGYFFNLLQIDIDILEKICNCLK